MSCSILQDLNISPACSPSCHKVHLSFQNKILSLQSELTALESRYDSLLLVKERASARYRADYKKWKDFKVWLFERNKLDKDTRKGMRKEEKLRQILESRVRTARKLEGLGLEEGDADDSGQVAVPTINVAEVCADVNLDSIKENIVQTPTKILPQISIFHPPSPPPPSVTVRSTSTSCRRTHHQSLRPDNAMHPPTSSKLIRKPYVPSPSQDSSQTEDDFTQTQSMITPRPPAIIPPRPLPLLHQVPTSKSGINAAVSPLVPTPPTSTSAEPRTKKDSEVRKRRRSNPSSCTYGYDADTDKEQPKKVLRASRGQEFSIGLDSDDSGGHGKHPEQLTRTPRGGPGMSDLSTDISHVHLSRNRPTTSAEGSAYNGTLREHSRIDSSTRPRTNDFRNGQNCSNDSSSKDPLKDYSGYKGRGRYAQAKTADSHDVNINAQYAIDKAQNGGLDFKYHGVVRNKEQRRHMSAGDCECCREYYEAVGPLPPRLQAPLWCSPPPSPTARPSHSNHAYAHDHDSRVSSPSSQTAITSHKQQISRHRYDWERPKTPPGYWNIGFPDTQEVDGINEKAKEMHKAKRKMVEREANKENGRYKKR